MAATFNMTATIIGGGVLSIPLSCARAGIIPFTLLMIVSAAITDFSLYLLVSCARRCGSTSFGRVAKSAYGPALELFTTGTIFFLVGSTVVGLMILNMGIWSPTIFAGIASYKGDEDFEATTRSQDAMVLLVLLGLMMHFLLQRDLTSLRHICYVGFCSIAVLCMAMGYRAIEKNVIIHPGLFQANVKWMASSFADVLNALPIIMQAFLCSFNIISVHCSLMKPTRDRVREVIRNAVMLSFLVMYVFGLSGYLFAYEETNGNILLCFDPKDPVILLGRIGCGITTLFALPMNTLPCREALLSMVAQISEVRARQGSSLEERRRLVEQGDLEECDVKGEQSASNSDEQNGFDAKKDYGTTDNNLPGSKQNGASGEHSIAFNEEVIHWIATFGIVSVCYVAAVLAPGVAIVWDIAGSSLAFLIQFIIPSACFIKLKLRTGHRASRNLTLAWALLAFAVIMTVLCSVQTAWRLMGKYA